MPSAAVQPIVALLTESVGGDPTQYMVEKAFAHHALDWRYLTLEVRREDLGEAIGGMRAMGFRGGHCGSTHKERVIPLLDCTSEVATLVGTANLIIRQDDQLVGENTEGKGFLAALRRLADPDQMNVVLFGAGRLARAIALELAVAGAKQITIVNRSAARAEKLAEWLAATKHISASCLPWEPRIELPADTQLLINATACGQNDPEASLPLAVEHLPPTLLVADVTTQPPQTRLLRDAAGRGCATLDGLSVYLERIAVDLQIWTGVDPSREVMREAVEEFLEL